ncbi:MAG: hypothetical protein ACP5NV_02715 [Candidatus Woesearchaeota archaeon]
MKSKILVKSKGLMKSKKSQMEMFGLALIVILIIVGFFLFISFRQKTPINDYKNDYIADETASNFVNSIINVNPKECQGNDYTLSDMLKFCARKDAVKCSGIDACTIANMTIHAIANKTLIAQQFAFRLYTKDLNWNNAEIIIQNRGCTTNSVKGQSGIIPISLYPVPKHVYLNLDICK